MIPNNIHLRLVFSHLTVIIVAMGLSGLLLLSLFEQYFLQATANSLLAQARITAQAILPEAENVGQEINSQSPLTNAVQQQSASNLYVEAANTSRLQASGFQLNASLTDVTVQLGAQLNTRVRILDAAGVVLVDSQQTSVGDNLAADALVQQASSGEYVSHAENDLIGLVLPVKLEEKVAALVYLSQPLNDVVAVLQDLRGRWGFSTGMGLLLSAVTGLFLSQVIVSPLRRLTAAAEAVAGGNLDQKVSGITSRDELGRLSRTFNEMTDRLRAARQMQTDFVANVSHELRTPLTAIKSLVETLRDGAVDDPSVRDAFLETVETETNRMIRLVNDLLLLSRADSHSLQLQRTPVELADFVQDVVTPFAARSPDAVQVQIPEGLYVAIDPDRTAQVFINLLDNALKYSRPEGKVTIQARANGDKQAVVTVQDAGIGIGAADLPRIGQRFYRTDKARSRQQGGSGLGIAIASVLVEAHRGRLWLESQEGVGTTVYFTLPLT